MHGAFPSLDLNSQQIVDPRRGSLIPSTPWEGLWGPIATWFGVDPSRLTEMMPNLPNFPQSTIPSVEHLFDP